MSNFGEKIAQQISTFLANKLVLGRALNVENQHNPRVAHLNIQLTLSVVVHKSTNPMTWKWADHDLFWLTKSYDWHSNRIAVYTCIGGGV